MCPARALCTACTCSASGTRPCTAAPVNPGQTFQLVPVNPVNPCSSSSTTAMQQPMPRRVPCSWHGTPGWWPVWRAATQPLGQPAAWLSGGWGRSCCWGRPMCARRRWNCWWRQLLTWQGPGLALGHAWQVSQGAKGRGVGGVATPVVECRHEEEGAPQLTLDGGG
jgi:hypothetical protein